MRVKNSGMPFAHFHEDMSNIQLRCRNFLLIALGTIILVPTFSVANDLPRNPKYQTNRRYIRLERVLPSDAFEGGWNKAWGSREAFDESGGAYVEDHEVLEAFSESFGQRFENHEELFVFLDTINDESDMSKATQLTLKLFGLHSVGTSRELGAILISNLFRSNSKLAEMILKKYTPEEIESFLQVAHAFDLRICNTTLLNLSGSGSFK